MKRPDIGIQGITIEHLKGMREAFDCYYSHIFQAMYGVEKLDHRLVSALIMSVEKDEFLPSKEDLLSYQAQFDREKETHDIIERVYQENIRKNK